MLTQNRTANRQAPVTFAIAAEEKDGINVSECPRFVISGNSNGITAKEMWDEIKKVGKANFLHYVFLSQHLFNTSYVCVFHDEIYSHGVSLPFFCIKYPRSCEAKPQKLYDYYYYFFFLNATYQVLPTFRL